MEIIYCTSGPELKFNTLTSFNYNHMHITTLDPLLAWASPFSSHFQEKALVLCISLLSSFPKDFTLCLGTWKCPEPLFLENF